MSAVTKHLRFRKCEQELSSEILLDQNPTPNPNSNTDADRNPGHNSVNVPNMKPSHNLIQFKQK